MSASAGILYGVSVGPGDPELVTVKAIRVMEGCPVIAVPRTGGEKTLALDIAGQAADLSGKEIIYLDFLMTSDRKALERRYAENAQRVISVLRTGRDAAMLNIGDVSVYSTYSYVAEVVEKAGYACKMIPGVTSFCACAALLNRSLTEATQPLCIYPGSFDGIEAALDTPGGKVLMKPASAMPSLRESIRRKGLAEKAFVVSDCGLPTQSVADIDDAVEKSYFTTVIIRP